MKQQATRQIDADLWDKRATETSGRSQASALVRSALFQHILHYYKIKKFLKKGYISTAIRNYWNLHGNTGREPENPVGAQAFLSVSVSVQPM